MPAPITTELDDTVRDILLVKRWMDKERPRPKLAQIQENIREIIAKYQNTNSRHIQDSTT